jgi:Carboxypeptidase regulatory-like domain
VGEKIEGELALTIRGDGAAIQGRVMSEGRPLPGASINVIPEGQILGWTMKTCISDDKGEFRISGIPPGDFRIRAWTDSPSLTDLLAGGGAKFTFQPGENKTVTLEVGGAEGTEHKE